MAGSTYGFATLTLLVASLLIASLAATRTTLGYNDIGYEDCRWAYSGGYSTLTVKWKWAPSPYTPSTTYQTAYNASRGDWDATSTPISFSYVTSPWWEAQHHLEAYDFGPSDTRYGTQGDGCSGGDRTYTYASLNTRKLDSESANFKRSVAGHELGHYIGPVHSTHTPALLNQSRNRNTVYVPQWDDVCAVNDYYPSTGWPVTCSW